MDKGVFLEVRAFASRKVKTGFLSSSVIPLEDIAKAFVETAKGTPLETFADATPKKFGVRDGFEVTLHPIATPVAIFAEKDFVLFGAITSFAGPGYHAFLVAALDAVKAKLGLRWETKSGMDDNTGYIRDRNPKRLQQAMAQFFKARCQNVVKQRGHPKSVGTPEAYLGISAAFGVEAEEGEILTPFGPRSLEEVEHWSALDGEALESAAADFYSWWDEGFHGSFFRGLALSILWMQTRWAKPLDRNERRMLVKVLDWLNEALRLGAPPVPIATVSELMDLVGPSAPDFPRPTGIGYRRRNAVATLNGWVIQKPGSLVAASAPAGTGLSRNDVFSVRTTTGVLGAPDPGAKPLALGEVDRAHGFHPADDGRGYQLDAVARTPSVNGPDRLCLMKIWMADEKLRGIAEAIADSVTLAKSE